MLGALVAQPVLIPFAAIGSAIGAAIAVAVAYRPSRRTTRDKPTLERPGARAEGRRSARRFSSLAVGAIVLSTLALSALLIGRFATQVKLPGETSSGGPAYERSLIPIRPMKYAASIEYDEAAGIWIVGENVRVPRADFLQRRLRGYRDGVASSPGQALGAGWAYKGRRGHNGEAIAFSRHRDLPAHVRSWPPTTEDAIPVAAIRVPALNTTFVPRNGSLVEIHAPAGFVRQTDPPEDEQHAFGDEEISTVRLEGLEDNPDHRTIHLMVANAFGRSSIYNGLESLTAWTFVKLLFGAIPGAIVGFFVARWLRKRYPDPA